MTQTQERIPRVAAAPQVRQVHAPDPLAERVRGHLQSMLSTFPWPVHVQDWTGRAYALGGEREHWSGRGALGIRLSPGGARDLLALDVARFLDRFVAGEVDLEGNLYLLAEVRNYTKVALKPLEVLRSRIESRVAQSPDRARHSVKSHYDIPEACLFYLDRAYRSYSCAMWERPQDLALDDALRVGRGEGDDWDSLEKAQWRKFAHAADYLAPGPGESVLDVGCGYPGFLSVTMDRHPRLGRVVGWTHSTNQVREGLAMLAEYDPRKFALNEGDYRQDDSVYDHVHSTGMISHVGPPGRDSGLVNYVRQIRRRIRNGGRYVHHSLMTARIDRPLFDHVGPAFNRKYVWPGFYWYTLGEHIRALEENGFQVVQVLNLSAHYAKTTRAWYERLVADPERFLAHADQGTYNAWRFFLGGSTGSLLNRNGHVYRILCEATDIERASVVTSHPSWTVSGAMPIPLPRHRMPPMPKLDVVNGGAAGGGDRQG